MNPVLIIVHIHSIFKYHISIPYSLSYYLFKNILNLCTYFIYSSTYSFHILIHLYSFIYSFTYSFHILIHILIHVYSFIYSFTYSFMCSFHILIHVYSFIYSFTYTHSYTHLCTRFIYSFMYFLSFVIFFWLYEIIVIYNLTALCVHDKLPFMFMFMFQFVFIFHITFMFHKHIYTYYNSCSYLHSFLPCIPINFNQAISTLSTTIQFSNKMWAPNAIKYNMVRF